MSENELILHVLVDEQNCSDQIVIGSRSLKGTGDAVVGYEMPECVGFAGG